MSNIKTLSFGALVFTECSREYLLEQGVPAATIDAVKKEQDVADVQAARRLAMAAESDPLYLEWQYDQTPESEKTWRDKVAEIKARYPLPGE